MGQYKKNSPGQGHAPPPLPHGQQPKTASPTNQSNQAIGLDSTSSYPLPSSGYTSQTRPSRPQPPQPPNTQYPNEQQSISQIGSYQSHAPNNGLSLPPLQHAAQPPDIYSYVHSVLRPSQPPGPNIYSYANNNPTKASLPVNQRTGARPPPPPNPF